MPKWYSQFSTFKFRIHNKMLRLRVPVPNNSKASLIKVLYHLACDVCPIVRTAVVPVAASPRLRPRRPRVNQRLCFANKWLQYSYKWYTFLFFCWFILCAIHDLRFYIFRACLRRNKIILYMYKYFLLT